MKLSEAQAIIKKANSTGFLVSMELHDPPFLRADSFPDIRAAEPPIPTEEEAWHLAEAFALATKGRYVNIYVTDHHHNPVPSYRTRMLNKLAVFLSEV